MYLSLYTDHIGQVELTASVSNDAYILGDPTKEQRVLDYIAAKQIDAISLYDLATITADPDLSSQLASFMARARNVGVVQIEAIGSESKVVWDRVETFHKTKAPFDGVVTEIEFWQGGSVSDLTSTLDYVRSKHLVAPGGAPIVLGAYIGWPSDGDIDALTAAVDRLYVHAYVKSPELAYPYISGRIDSIAAHNGTSAHQIDVVPIFSAEDTMWAAGAEHFMGEWLAAHSLSEAESTLLEDWSSSAPSGVPLTGFQYYEFFFLSQYIPLISGRYS